MSDTLGPHAHPSKEGAKARHSHTDPDGRTWSAEDSHVGPYAITHTHVRYADSCEELVHREGDPPLKLSGCRGKGLLVTVHPDGKTRKVLCGVHSRKAYLSGYLVDWDESERVFESERPKGQLSDRIGKGSSTWPWPKA